MNALVLEMNEHVDVLCVVGCLRYVCLLGSFAGGWSLTYLSVLYGLVGLSVCLVKLSGFTTRVVVNLTLL